VRKTRNRSAVEAADEAGAADEAEVNFWSLATRDAYWIHY